MSTMRNPSRSSGRRPRTRSWPASRDLLNGPSPLMRNDLLRESLLQDTSGDVHVRKHVIGTLVIVASAVLLALPLVVSSRVQVEAPRVGPQRGRPMEPP